MPIGQAYVRMPHTQIIDPSSKIPELASELEVVVCKKTEEILLKTKHTHRSQTLFVENIQNDDS